MWWCLTEKAKKMRSNLTRKQLRKVRNKYENVWYIEYTCTGGTSHGRHSNNTKYPNVADFRTYLEKEHKLHEVRITACVQIKPLRKGVIGGKGTQ